MDGKRCWNAGEIAKAMREVGTWVLAYATEFHIVDQHAACEAQKLLDNISFLRSRLDTALADSDARRQAEVAFITCEQHLQRVIGQPDFVRQLHEQMGEPAPTQAELSTICWMSDEDASECQRTMNAAAAHVEAASRHKVQPAGQWVTGKEASERSGLHAATIGRHAGPEGSGKPIQDNGKRRSERRFLWDSVDRYRSQVWAREAD